MAFATIQGADKTGSITDQAVTDMISTLNELKPGDTLPSEFLAQLQNMLKNTDLTVD